MKTSSLTRETHISREGYFFDGKGVSARHSRNGIPRMSVLRNLVHYDLNFLPSIMHCSNLCLCRARIEIMLYELNFTDITQEKGPFIISQ